MLQCRLRAPVIGFIFSELHDCLSESHYCQLEVNTICKGLLGGYFEPRYNGTTITVQYISGYILNDLLGMARILSRVLLLCRLPRTNDSLYHHARWVIDCRPPQDWNTVPLVLLTGEQNAFDFPQHFQHIAMGPC